MRKFQFRKLKRIIKNVYELFFCDPYHRLKKRYSKPVILHHTYDVRELFFQENDATGFNRYDMIVRLLAIENYYGLNDYGWNLYRKQQTSRKAGEWQNAEKCFRTLIKSYEDNGYDEKSEILLDSNLRLWDGSHRMAMAFYYHHYTISCQVMPITNNVYYGIDWYLENDFTLDEIAKIQRRFKSLLEEAKVPFVCTLWAPVAPYFSEITERLKLMCDVKSYQDYTFDESKYNEVVRQIYAADDIEKWKVEKKIDYMRENIVDGKWKIRVIYLNVATPQFRIKASTRNTLSSKCEYIKRIIRNCYKDKVPSYYYDIVCHIGDNFYQNEFIRRMFRYVDFISHQPKEDIDFKNSSNSNNTKDEIKSHLISLLSILKIHLKLCHIPTSEVCVVGSSILAALGIRVNNDVDFVMSSNYRKQFCSSGVIPFSENVEMVSKNWAKSNRRITITDDELISNPKYHFKYAGLKFASIDLLLERKEWQGREKDIKDVELIKQYLQLCE